MNTDLKNDIMSRLQKGEDIENIAQEFSDIINQANAQYVNDQKAAEDKKKAAQHRKAVALKAFIDSISEIGAAWGYQKEVDEALEDITAEDIDDMVKDLDKFMPMVLQYISLFDALTDARQLTAEKTKDTEAEAPKEAINHFLDLWVR